MNDLQNKTIYNCLSIIYDLNKEINLLESIGFLVEEVKTENNIGGYIYESISNAYSIIQDTLIDGHGAFDNIIYDISETIDLNLNKDSKENIIKIIIEYIENIENTLSNATKDQPPKLIPNDTSSIQLNYSPITINDIPSVTLTEIVEEQEGK